MNFSDNFKYYLGNEVIIDDFNYQYDDDVQDVYVEGGDGGNPTVRADSTTPNWKIGTNCVRFPITDSTHTSTWTATIGAIDISEFTGVATGVPTTGKIKHLITVSSTTAISAISYRIGSDSSNYLTWTPTMPSTTATWAQEGDLSGLSATGTPDWKNVTYVQIRVTSTTGTPTLDLSGLRITPSTRVTGGVWSEPTTTAGVGQSLSWITSRQTSPTVTMNGSSATDIVTNDIYASSFGNFTAFVKARFHSASGTNREFGIMFRGSDYTEGSEDFYSVALDDANSLIRFDKWVAGSRTALKSATYDPSVDTDYWIKLEASGSRVKVYVSTDGLNYTKYIDTTDATFSSGGVGLYVNGTPSAEFYFLQVFDRPYVVFDDWSFYERGMVNTVNVQEDSAPQLDIQNIDLANVDKSIFVNKNFRSKFIEVRGNITTSTQSDLTNTIDNIKQHVSQESKVLRIGKQTSNSGVFDERTYTANAVNLDQMFRREPWHTTYMPFTVVFQAPDGIAKAPSSISIPSFSWDEYTFTRYVNFKGSASPLPVLTYTLTDATPASGSVSIISINNSITGKTITVTKSSAFANSDVVTFDFANQSVTINGSLVDYTGFIDSSFFTIGQNRVVTTITSTSTIDQSNGAPSGSYSDKTVIASQTSSSLDKFYAQSFKVSATTTYPKIEMFMYTRGTGGIYISPYGIPVLEVQTDTAGSPSGSLVNAGASCTLNSNSSSGSFAWVPFVLSTTASLSSATTYWIVLKHAAFGGGTLVSDADCGTYRATTNSGYSSGSIKYSIDGGTSWVADDSTHDLSFRVYAAGATAISGTLAIAYKPRYV